MTPISDDLPAAFEPWDSTDLNNYLTTIGEMFEQVEEYAEDSAEGSGWSILLDPDRAPYAALPHLAMYVGERLPPGLGDALSREWIKDAPNRVRGTPYSIFRAAQRTLTGTRTVGIFERSGGVGDPGNDEVTVITYVGETPDPELVERDLRRTVFPADLVLNYLVLAGQPWLAVATNFATWADVAAQYATWGEVAFDVAGITTWTRPVPE